MRLLILNLLTIALTALAPALGEQIAHVSIDSSSSRLGMSWLPEKTLDGDVTTNWASSKTDAAPFVAYVFDDGPVSLGLVQVTGHDYSKWRIDTAILSYREGDSGDWTQPGPGPIQFNTAQASVTEIDFGGVMAKYVKIEPLTTFDGTTYRTIADNPGDGATSDWMVTYAEIAFNTLRGIADAGADQQVYDADDNAEEIVTLDGSASEYPGGTITSYVWSLDGTDIATGVAPTVTLAVGVHAITLSVTTSDATVETDTVEITVVGTPQSFAKAGDDQVVVDTDDNGSELITLDGTGSAWSTATWEWREDQTVLGTGATLQVTLAVGVHTITLYATDASGHHDSDDVIIDVRAGAQPPVADAGFDRTVMDANGSGDELVSLDGTSSIDYDGTVASYTWTVGDTQIATGATPQVTLPVGESIITLTVTDNEGRADTDTVRIVVIEYVPSATDQPCVGAVEADNLFDQITAEDMEIIRSKKILFASRSFGLNTTDGLTRMRNIDPMYALNWIGGFNVRVEGPSAIPDDVFDQYNFVHYLCSNSPETARVTEFDSILRTRFAESLDAAILFYDTADVVAFPTYSMVLDSLRLDYPDIQFVYVTSGAYPVPDAPRNIVSNQFGDQVMATYRGQVPIYDLLSILSTHEDGSVATFEANGQIYRYMCPEFNINGDDTHPNADFSEERMGKAMLVLLHQMFVKTPKKPGDANLDGTVDLNDFVILKTHFGSGRTWGEGDFDEDGDVDLNDFVILKTNFGT